MNVTMINGSNEMRLIFRDLIDAVGFLEAQSYLSTNHNVEFGRDVNSGYGYVNIASKEHEFSIDIPADGGFHLFKIQQCKSNTWIISCNGKPLTEKHFLNSKNSNVDE